MKNNLKLNNFLIQPFSGIFLHSFGLLPNMLLSMYYADKTLTYNNLGNIYNFLWLILFVITSKIYIKDSQAMLSTHKVISYICFIGGLIVWGITKNPLWMVFGLFLIADLLYTGCYDFIQYKFPQYILGISFIYFCTFALGVLLAHWFMPNNIVFGIFFFTLFSGLAVTIACLILTKGELWKYYKKTKIDSLTTINYWLFSFKMNLSYFISRFIYVGWFALLLKSLTSYDVKDSANIILIFNVFYIIRGIFMELFEIYAKSTLDNDKKVAFNYLRTSSMFFIGLATILLFVTCLIYKALIVETVLIYIYYIAYCILEYVILHLQLENNIGNFNIFSIVIQCLMLVILYFVHNFYVIIGLSILVFIIQIFVVDKIFLIDDYKLKNLFTLKRA